MVTETTAMAPEEFKERVADVHRGYEDLRNEIGKVIIGQEEVVNLMIISMFMSIFMVQKKT